MATRSRIGLQLADGAILSVYHHWDGYPHWLGVTLEKYFNNRSLISELIDGGDMSSCRSDSGWEDEIIPTERPLYYSERGEDCPPKLANNINELFDQCDYCDAEYVYVYDISSRWICYDHRKWSDTYKMQVNIPLV